MLTYSFHAFKQLAADLNLQSDLVNWSVGMFYPLFLLRTWDVYHLCELSEVLFYKDVSMLTKLKGSSFHHVNSSKIRAIL